MNIQKSQSQSARVRLQNVGRCVAALCLPLCLALAGCVPEVARSGPPCPTTFCPDGGIPRLFASVQLSPSSTQGILEFTVDAATGAITSIPGSLGPTAGITSLAGAVSIDPSRKFLLFAGAASTGPLKTWAIGDDGSLTVAATSPTGNNANGSVPVVDSTGQHAYVANEPGFNISGFALGSDGSLAPLAGSPYSVGGQPQMIVPHPSLPFLFVANASPLAVQVYPLAADGSIGALLGSVTVATFPSGLVIDPSGQHLIAVSRGASNAVTVELLSFDGTTLSAGPTQTGTLITPGAPVIHPNGRWVYVNGGGDTQGLIYSIDPGPALNVVGPFSIAGGGGPSPEALQITPDGNFLYSTTVPFSQIVGFRIDPGTGIPSPLPGSPFSYPFGGPAAEFPAGTSSAQFRAGGFIR